MVYIGAMNKGDLNLKGSRISIRVTPEMKARMDAAVAMTGLEEAILVRHCLDALLDHIELKKQITFPITISGPLIKPVSDLLNESNSKTRSSLAAVADDVVQEVQREHQLDHATRRPTAPSRKPDTSALNYSGRRKSK